MPEVRPEILLVDMLISTNKIIRKTKNVTAIQLVENEEAFGLVLREIQEIGELSKKLRGISGPWHQIDIPWRDIIIFRNLIVHRYFSVEPEIIFEVATSQIPSLEKKVFGALKKVQDRQCVFRAISGMKTVFQKFRRKETVDYLNYIEYLLSVDQDMK